MNNKLKIIMIDGFKTDYFKYAPYLKSLTEKFQHGELEMPAGHYGGVEILYKGKSDKLALFVKSENSSLKFVKYFLWLDYFGKFGRFVIDSIINFIRLIKGYELFRTGKIPLKELWKFDFAIKKPLYKIKGVDRKGFYELDEIAHKYGTKSKQVEEEIKKIDRKISKMNWDIIFSDHGMIDIRKTISVPMTKNCFIDSDMARYYGSEKELKEIRKKLPLKYGKIINWKDKRFGQLIFLANSGNLILPNFWQGNEKVKAMHGYDGRHREMKAIYIIKKYGKKKNLNAKQLHKILRQMLKDNK